MLTVEQFLKSCAHESKIIKFLGAKVPETALDYRPTEGQRNLLELMQYLTATALVPMAWAEDGNWDRAQTLSADIGSVGLANFGESMDRQMAKIDEMAAGLADRDLQNAMTMMPWQEPCTLGEFLVNAVIKSFTAYRMQFFLYCKAAGIQDLTSAQCWIGVDSMPAPPAE